MNFPKQSQNFHVVQMVRNHIAEEKFISSHFISKKFTWKVGKGNTQICYRFDVKCQIWRHPPSDDDALNQYLHLPKYILSHTNRCVFNGYGGYKLGYAHVMSENAEIFIVTSSASRTTGMFILLWITWIVQEYLATLPVRKLISCERTT